MKSCWIWYWFPLIIWPRFSSFWHLIIVKNSQTVFATSEIYFLAIPLMVFFAFVYSSSFQMLLKGFLCQFQKSRPLPYNSTDQICLSFRLRLSIQNSNFIFCQPSYVLFPRYTILSWLSWLCTENNKSAPSQTNNQFGYIQQLTTSYNHPQPMWIQWSYFMLDWTLPFSFDRNLYRELVQTMQS